MMSSGIQTPKFFSLQFSLKFFKIYFETLKLKVSVTYLLMWHRKNSAKDTARDTMHKISAIDYIH